MVKNPPANVGDIRDVVQSLGREDPLEEGSHSNSILAWKNPMDRGAWRARAHGVEKSQTRLIELSTNT